MKNKAYVIIRWDWLFSSFNPFPICFNSLSILSLSVSTLLVLNVMVGGFCGMLSLQCNKPRSVRSSEGPTSCPLFIRSTISQDEWRKTKNSTLLHQGGRQWLPWCTWWLISTRSWFTKEYVPMQNLHECSWYNWSSNGIWSVFMGIDVQMYTLQVYVMFMHILPSNLAAWSSQKISTKNDNP